MQIGLTDFKKNNTTSRPEAYSKTSQTSKIELFKKIVNGWKPLTIFAKSFILDVLLGSGHTFAVISYIDN